MLSHRIHCTLKWYTLINRVEIGLPIYIYLCVYVLYFLALHVNIGKKKSCEFILYMDKMFLSKFCLIFSWSLHIFTLTNVLCICALIKYIVHRIDKENKNDQLAVIEGENNFCCAVRQKKKTTTHETHEHSHGAKKKLFKIFPENRFYCVKGTIASWTTNKKISLNIW